MGKWGCLKLTAAFLLFFWLNPLAVRAGGMQTIYNSPYVTFSPDGKAWTTQAGDTAYTWYPQGMSVGTGIPSALHEPGRGEHFYNYTRQGLVPVKKWVVSFQAGKCIHKIYPASYHGLSFGRRVCEQPYNSGWTPYCADCGEILCHMHIYMGRQAVETLDYLDMRADLDYYFLCPHCKNLEQGAVMGSHICKEVSWNRYWVAYHPNTADRVEGVMANSFHMYNDMSLYEGSRVAAATCLSRNAYVRQGYEFAGWNTRPDGGGTAYEDGERIRNLTDVNEGTVTLYAQWRVARSPIRTRQLEVEQGENVYHAQEKLWYVRSDGVTPFVLRHRAYLEGEAFPSYQPNYAFFEITAGGLAGKDVLYTPSAAIQDGEIRTEAGSLTATRQGSSLLGCPTYFYTVRSGRNRELLSVQKYVPSSGLSGTRFWIMPAAGADSFGEVVCSQQEKDMANGIYVVADGEAPFVKGMELLDNRELIDRGGGSLLLEVSAADELSGVRELSVSVSNADNGLERVCLPDADGCVRIEITEDDPLFSGDLTVTARAVDRVGNVTEVSRAFTEFALKARVERILEPHEPLFKRGESGILKISVWGYAERVEVEFPEEMTALDSGLNRTFSYTDDPAALQREEIVFMIPLDTPANRQYTITVRAYKGDKKLEEHPAIGTVQVEGTVLEEFHTRLR